MLDLVDDRRYLGLLAHVMELLMVPLLMFRMYIIMMWQLNYSVTLDVHQLANQAVLRVPLDENVVVVRIHQVHRLSV